LRFCFTSVYVSCFLYFYSFFDIGNAPLKSFNDLEGPYISTPPRYIRAPIAPNQHMVPIKIPIDKEICQTGTSSIPTHKNIIIGAKNGIKDDIVINFTYDFPKPNKATKNAIITRSTIGKTKCCTSSTLLTSEPNIAEIVAYKKYPSKKKTTA